MRVVPPKQLPAALIAAAETSDEIWVGGGDGTLRSAAELVMKRDGVLGVLPLGTMNLLARDLNIPLEIEQAVAAPGDDQGTLEVGNCFSISIGQCQRISQTA